MTNRHALAHDVGIVARYLAPRWKAVVALVGTLITAVVGVTLPGAAGAVTSVVTALLTTLGVHQVANQPLLATLEQEAGDVVNADVPAATTSTSDSGSTVTVTTPTPTPEPVTTPAAADDDTPGA